MSESEREAARQRVIQGYRNIIRETEQMLRDLEHFNTHNIHVIAGEAAPIDTGNCRVIIHLAGRVVEHAERNERIPDALCERLDDAIHRSIE